MLRHKSDFQSKELNKPISCKILTFAKNIAVNLFSDMSMDFLEPSGEVFSFWEVTTRESVVMGEYKGSTL